MSAIGGKNRVDLASPHWASRGSCVSGPRAPEMGGVGGREERTESASLGAAG